jgi:DNA invertase Pin-like site-specific DNA recombinase
MTHLALYARCSTTDQDLAVQLSQLREYAARRDAAAVEFTDHGVSGAKAVRPGLDALMAAFRRREVDAVVCTRLDRLGRSAAHLAMLAEELRSLGVGLVVLDLGLDTATPQGALVLGVLASVAEFERELIRERVREGVANARQRGVRLGRPPALDRRALARARRMRQAGRSYRAIGDVLGVEASTVLRALQRAK